MLEARLQRESTVQLGNVEKHISLRWWKIILERPGPSNQLENCIPDRIRRPIFPVSVDISAAVDLLRRC